MPTTSHPVLDRVLFSTPARSTPAPAAFGGEPARDDHGRFAPGTGGSGGTGPRPDLHPDAVVTESQGDGFKIETPHGHIDYRPRPGDGVNEIWWVESHKKGHGSELVDMMQKNHPADGIGWGVTTPAGKGLRDKWHAAHPGVEKQDGAFEGQFDPSGDNYGEDAPEPDDEFDDEFGDDETHSLFALFGFNPDKHPRDAKGLFVPADGGVIEPMPEDGATGQLASPPALEAASKKWADGLTASEFKAVGQYTDEAYSEMNPALRADPDGAGLDPRIKKLAQKLDAAIRKYPPFAEPVTSFRGVSVSDDRKLARLDAAFNAALATGEPITMNGFSSADLDPARAASRAGEGRPVLEIRSRRGAYVRAASSCKGEHEILHTHGDRFKVVGVKTVKYKMRWGGLIPRKTYVLEAVEDAPEAQFGVYFGGWESEGRDEHGRWVNGPAATAHIHWKTGDVPKAVASAGHKWAGRLSADEEEAVNNYTSDGYRYFNYYLRDWASGGTVPQEYAQKVTAVDAAIRKAPSFAKPVTSYRGLAVNSDEKLARIEAGLVAAMETGKPITFHGFTSSSLDPTRAGGFSDYAGSGDRPILVIKSRRGAYIEDVTATGGENEILHTHGDRFQVTGVEFVSYTSDMGHRSVRKTYYLEAVPEGPPPLPPLDQPHPKAAQFGWEDQPRAENGQWGDGGASGSAPGASSGAAPLERIRDVPPAVLRSGIAWANGLSDAERSAVDDYTDFGYEAMSAALRGVPDAEPLSGRERAQVAAIDAAVRRAPPWNPPLTTYRGLNSMRRTPTKLIAMRQALAAALATGEPITMNGFTSSSVNPWVGSLFAREYDGTADVLEIKSPRGAYVGVASRKPEELEVIHTHGERFTVTGVRTQQFRDGDETRTRRVYTLEAAPEPPPALDPARFVAFDFDESQPRAEDGKWTAGGGGSAGPKTPDGVLYHVPSASPELKGRADAWEQALTQTQKNAVYEYTGDNFDPINRKLRECPETFDCLRHLRDDAARLQKVIHDFPRHDPPLTTYRGVASGRPGEKGKARIAEIEAGLAAALASGGTLTMHGFQSSSIDPHFAAKWATGNEEHGLVMEIKSPRGAYIAGLSDKPDEQEVLHAHGEKYTVTGSRRQVVQGPGGQKLTRTIYTLEAVADTPPTVPFSAEFGWAEQSRDDHGRWGAGTVPATAPGDPDHLYSDTEARPASRPNSGMPIDMRADALKWHDSLSPAEIAAAESYCIMGFMPLNSDLAASGGDPDALRPDLRATHDALASAIKKYPPFEKPVTVWRGASIRAERAETFLAACAAAAETGATVSMPCFQSCSFDPAVARSVADGTTDEIQPDPSGKGKPRRELLLEIRARTGAWVGGTEMGIEKENELIALPNTKYTVRGVKEVPFDTGDGITVRRKVVQLEEVAPAPAPATVAPKRAAAFSTTPVLDRILFAAFSFDESQARDAHGRWTAGGSADTVPAAPAVERPPLGPGSEYDAPAEVDRAARWESSLSYNEKRAVSTYAGSAFDPVNHLLRAAATGTEVEHLSPGEVADFLALARTIDGALRKAPPAAVPFKSWRGISSSTPSKVQALRDSFDAALATGDTITTNGFSSSSFDPPFAARWAKPAPDGGKVVLEITGRRGLYTSSVAGNTSESEVVHTHGERFKVVGVRDQRYVTPYGEFVTARTYSLEEVPDAPPPLDVTYPPVRAAGFGFDPDQPRGADGRWGGGESGSASGPAAGSTAATYPVGDPRHDYGDSTERPEYAIMPRDVPGDLRIRAGLWEMNWLAPVQREAIKYYTAGEFARINKELARTGGAVGDVIEEPVDPREPAGMTLRALGRHIVQSAWAHGPHDPPLTCWRVMRGTPERMTAFVAAAEAAAATGAEIGFDNFGSSTLNPQFAVEGSDNASVPGKPGLLQEVGGISGPGKQRVLLEIRSTTGLYVGSTSLTTFQRENEVIQLPAARYKVRGWKDVKFGSEKRRVLQLDELPPDPRVYAGGPADTTSGLSHSTAGPGRLPAGEPDPAFSDPRGRDGDLDPAGHWVTISGNNIHINSEGEIDAGGHPALRKVLEEKAAIPPALTGDPRHDYGDTYKRPTLERLPDQMPRAFRERAAKWTGSLTDEQVKSIKSYMGAGYRPMNRAMSRTGGDFDGLPAVPPTPSAGGLASNDPPQGQSWRDVADNIMAAFRAAGPLVEPVTAWRTLRMAPAKMTAFLAAADAAQATGDPLTFPTFGSTTLNPNWAPDATEEIPGYTHEPRPGVLAVTEVPGGPVTNHRILMEIRSKSGLWIGGVPGTGSYQHENELLQPPQARYKVTGWKEVGFGDKSRRVLQLEELEPDPAIYAAPTAPAAVPTAGPNAAVVSDLDRQKAHTLSEDEFRSAPPSGFAYDPNLPHEADTHSRPGTITVGPKFFAHPADVREGIVTHEIGHALSDAMLDDGTAFRLIQQGAYTRSFFADGNERIDMIHDNTPGENAAQAYAELVHRGYDLRMNFPQAHRATAEAALRHGFPVPAGELQHYPDLQAHQKAGTRPTARKVRPEENLLHEVESDRQAQLLSELVALGRLKYSASAGEWRLNGESAPTAKAVIEGAGGRDQRTLKEERAAYSAFAAAATTPMAQAAAEKWKKKVDWRESNLKFVAPWLVGAEFSDPAGRAGDLDPDGHWRTVSGNRIHITADGEIDAGGHPKLREILADKAGLKPKAGSGVAARPAPADMLAALGTHEYRERVRGLLSPMWSYPPFYERLGVPMDDAKKAAWKDRCAKTAAELGRKLASTEICAELAFPNQQMHGARLKNFIDTGDPDVPAAPLPPPGEHGLERAAKSVGGWLPSDYPDDAAFLASDSQLKWLKREQLDVVRTIVPGATMRDFAALACWRPGDQTPSAYTGNPGEVRLSILGNDKQVAVILRRTPNGPDVHIEGFYSAKSKQGKGAGTRAIATLVAVGRRLGLAQATLGAVGYGPQAPADKKESGRGTPCNGYYTWPMLGFDREFDEEDRKHLAVLPEAFRGAKRLSELLSMPGGPTAWKRHGWSVSCELLLNRDDTPGMRVLTNYLAAKAAKSAAEAPK